MCFLVSQSRLPKSPSKYRDFHFDARFFPPIDSACFTSSAASIHRLFGFHVRFWVYFYYFHTLSLLLIWNNAGSVADRVSKNFFKQFHFESRHNTIIPGKGCESQKKTRAGKENTGGCFRLTLSRIKRIWNGRLQRSADNYKYTFAC